jgi:D-arabinose 1-dehydrogenase-like Zn-dependent alcohol dehydrogenase
MELIPTSVCLTVYAGGPDDFMATPLDEIAQRIVNGGMNIPIKTYQLEEISEAHRAMDENKAGAKMVVLL